MRIAMLAPLYEPVPPPLYGGTERVVYYLTEELVRRGHDIVLIASGDSRTSARLIAVCDGAMNRQPATTDPVAYHVLQLGMMIRHAREFDLIHSHCDFRAVPLADVCGTPVVSTNHNRLDVPENVSIIRRYPDAPVTALSYSHKRQLTSARWLGVCHNGIPVDSFPFRGQPGSYLAFVGRLSPEKGPLHAIEVSEQTGIPLKIAGKINVWERDYFESTIRPRLRHGPIEYVGELDEESKRQFLANACALIFPICWPEPFGMVTIEAMATGTPVLAFPMGAVPEIVDDGVTGFVCQDVASMVARAWDIPKLDRGASRRRVAQYFSERSMADAYEAVYARFVGESET